INPERLLVQVDRNLGQSAVLRDTAVKQALILHDQLQTSVRDWLSEGVEIVSVSADEADPAIPPPQCDVCGDPIEGFHVVCTVCRTPFHRDCWTFIGACSTFGCSSKSCQTV
ncbi:MAG TPA: RING finger protein, partial [Isosphaeraceae bacterium]|nr:RING finger protein [Isosphaeraceae bacterium]